MSIKISNLSAYYGKDSVFETKALNDINLTIKIGEFIGLIGSTGSGKSTLIQHLNGLIIPEQGTIEVEGETITKDSKNLSELRKKVGLVFQYPEYQLFEETVEKDIAFGPNNLKLSPEEVQLRVKEAMELVDLPYEDYAERNPFDLSGGEKRRVAIAGVLAMKPKVLMLDEPTAGLDPHTRKELLWQFKRLMTEKEMTIIMVSHSMDEVSLVADRVVALNKGSIVLDAPIREAFKLGDQIEEIGLELPTIPRLFNYLQKEGYNVDGSILTLDEAEEKLLEVLRA